MIDQVSIGETIEVGAEERKRQIAYRLWEDEGQPDGKAEEHWLQACLVVMSMDNESKESEIEIADPDWLLRQPEPPPALPEMTAAKPGAPDMTIETIRQRIASRHAA